MTTPTDDTASMPPQQPQPPAEKAKRIIELTIPVALLSLLFVIALGFVGGIVSHAIFPAHNGAQGKQGARGDTGPEGPSGQAGSQAKLDLTNIGYCVDVTYNNSGTVSFVQGVSIFSPNIHSEALSCPSGNFVSMAPTPN